MAQIDKIRILVAGDPASIHANRFVNLLQEIGYEVRVFQSEHYYWQEEHLRNSVLYVSAFNRPPDNGPVNGNILKITHPFEVSYSRWIARILAGVSIVKNIQLPSHQRLAKILKSWHPDIIFSLKMQND